MAGDYQRRPSPGTVRIVEIQLGRSSKEERPLTSSLQTRMILRYLPTSSSMSNVVCSAVHRTSQHGAGEGEGAGRRGRDELDGRRERRT